VYDFHYRQCEEVPVSKVKSPNEKKALSLKRDRRNTYGENPAASRKGIMRGKQRSHMGERRAVSQILSHLREGAGESDADEADVRAKTKLVERKHKAFKKSPDSPLGVVIKRKLARREKLSQSQTDGPARVDLKIHSEGVFETPYIRAFHKRTIMFHLRYRINAHVWGANKNKGKLVRAYERKEAGRWREAILRDAPLLKGFFTEEPQWRERMLRWCEKVLAVDSDSDKSR
jgi:hypothetical protein